MNLRSIFFIILGLLISTSSAYSAVYHIDPGAPSGGNGSVQAPYNEWADLPRMNTGDDVYFKSNTTLVPASSITVRWGGTEDNPAIIGAYYLNNGNVVYGENGSRPIISGSNYTVPSNICQGGASDTWMGLIEIRGRDFVQVRDLHIYKSGWAGIRFEGDISSDTSNVGFVVDNCKIEGAYSTGIWINKSKHNNGIVSNCEVTLTSASFGILNNRQGDRCESDWGAGITVTNSPYSYTTIRNNYVHEQWGEGISSTRVQTPSAYNNCGYVTIEDNVVWNNRRVDVYVNLTEGNTVRRNVLLGANDPKFSSASSDNRTWNQYGIWVNNEYRDSPLPNANRNNSFYGNFVAGHYSGIGLSSYYNTGRMENLFFYNNTSIGNKNNYTIGKNLSNIDVSGIVFKNNISYCPPDTICQDVSSDPSWFGRVVDAEFNAWTNMPNNWATSADVITNNKWAKITGWQDVTRIPSVSDLIPTSGNPVIYSGTALPAPFDQLVSTQYTKYQSAPLDILVVTSTQTKSSESNWHMGAVFNKEPQSPAGNSNLIPPTLSIVVGQ